MQGKPMFDGLLVGPDDQARCVRLGYAGPEVPAVVRLSGSHTPGAPDLAGHLLFDVDLGVGAAGRGDCAGFSKSTDLFTGTLADFTATHYDGPSGLEVWRPHESPDDRSVRFSVRLAAGAIPAGATASADFQWEALPT